MSSLEAPRILIVEDNEDDALLLQLEVKRLAPHASFRRVDCEAALRKALVDSEWDLVICDHSMPQFDSSRALGTLNECGHDIPFVIYSGDLEESVALQAMRSGAQDFVSKRDPARLIPVIERELRNSGLRRAKREADSSIVRLSRYDVLTRLPNRQSLTEVIEGALAGPCAEEDGTALLVLDLDRFMRINDSFGYDVGDDLLRQVSARLQVSAGTSANVARLGEDEFGVFVAAPRGALDATTLAERIERAFSQPFKLAGHEIYVTFSMGLARFPEHGDSAATLMKNAESAMFRAKRRGGNRIQIYDHGINHRAGHRLLVENALRGAIARDELSVLYQPVVDLRAGRVIGTEALVRWRHPRLGTIMPDEFIPVAEEIGTIVDIGEWVLHTAASQTQAWRRSGFPSLKVAVNLSAEQFNGTPIAERISRLLSDSGLPPEALELEITESVAMRDAAAAVRTLRALKAQGVEIAMDDFGTGFSSLSYLKRFPIDILKVDKSFVQDLPDDDEDAAIVRMIAALGQSLGLTLHAEGIESLPQRHFLLAQGCHRAQGYGISPPLAAEEVPAFLAAHGLALAPAPARMAACC
jgi:diguanylate cyclase (GGDEF)-like protein